MDNFWREHANYNHSIILTRNKGLALMETVIITLKVQGKTLKNNISRSRILIFVAQYSFRLTLVKSNECDIFRFSFFYIIDYKYLLS